MMPFVSSLTLFVEGAVDSPIVNAIIGFYGLKITVTIGGSKSGLISKVVDARNQSSTKSTFLLRDRDFDFDVDMAHNVPCKIPSEGTECFGWHWCRHEMENYLLEPDILRQYLSSVTKKIIQKQTVEDQICKAALNIRDYQVARRTIGISKRKALLPHPYNLGTRPDDVDEFKLPTCLSRNFGYQWVMEKTSGYLSQVNASLCEMNVDHRYNESEQFYSVNNCSDIPWILRYFSGKDLFAALKPWLESLGINRNTKKFVEEDFVPWVSDNMENLIGIIPEWTNLYQLLLG